MQRLAQNRPMPLIRHCPSCGRSNRIPARHLADVGKCGARKAELPAVGEPIEVNEEEFFDNRDAIIR
jgi:thioredoxin 2